MLQCIFNKSIVTKEILYFLDGFIKINCENFNYEDLNDTLRFITDKDILLRSYAEFEIIDEVYNYFCNSFNCMVRMLRKKMKNNLIDVLDKYKQEDFSFVVDDSDMLPF